MLLQFRSLASALLVLAIAIPAHAGTTREADAFSRPLAFAAPEQEDRFALGRSFFKLPWIAAPASVTARDGLGPLFAANACQACHVGNGRGHPPMRADEPVTAATVLTARRDDELPHYGAQLQTRAIAPLRPEASVRVQWNLHRVRFPDGSTRELRSPAVEVSGWQYGAPVKPVRASLRIAPAMIGLGLLEAIPAADIERHAAAQRTAGGGGFPNRVTDLASGAQVLGRFGWKAGQPSVRQQSLKAFAEDLGITSALFPADACTEMHGGCRQMPQGGSPELEPGIGEAVVFHVSHLAPPARRRTDDPGVVAGESLFHAAGCAGCHRPRWRTGAVPGFPALSGREILPYTDLLLHDMGEGLADGMRDGLASGRHWRTAPLWGLGHTHAVSGAKAGFLHDGRARDLVEAILWHGGEAGASRNAWMALPAVDRDRVIRFLESL